MKVHMSVSIIVAVYNVGEYIAECLESIIPLDKRVIEILCVDDGSSDQSVDIIRKYQQKDKRIQLLQKKKWWDFECQKLWFRPLSRQLCCLCGWR